ncbi:MAG: flagellar basal-body MS-ring/collar protein FliF [Maricaulaceae bacterium]
MNTLLEQIAKFGVMRLVALAGVTAGVAISLLMIGFRLGGAPMALLYSGLDLQDAAEITQRLDAMGLAYDLRGDGSTIFVEADHVAKARISLSQDGLPISGSLGYEIFDEQDAFGSTSFVQNINRVRALEGELTRTISAIRGVRTALVHLVLHERLLFDRDQDAPSASIMVSAGSGGVDQRTARAIRNLVASAVPGLEAERVTVLDEQGRMLAGGDADDIAGVALEDRKSATERRIRQAIMDILDPVVGPNAARVQVSADLDFNRITETAQIYDPDGQVIVSEETVENQSEDNEADGLDNVSSGDNLPDTSPPSEDGSGTRSSRAATTSRSVVNYENSLTTRTQVREVGAIRQLSVAVAVDGVTTFDEEGEPVYRERSEAEMAQILALVRTAMGYNQARGDQLEVLNVQFTRPEAVDRPLVINPLPFNLQKADLLRLGEIAVLLLVGLAIVLFVARPLAKSLINPTPSTSGGLAAISGGGAAALSGPNSAALPAPAVEAPDTIDVARIEGQVSASSVRQVTDVVQGHPEESISILRTWMSER